MNEWLMHTPSPLPVSFIADLRTIDRLDALALSMGRSREWVLNRAVEDFIILNQDFVSDVKAGIEADNNKDYATTEEVTAIFEKYKMED